MANDNETVAEIVREMRAESDRGPDLYQPVHTQKAYIYIGNLADRIEAAHRREILVERKLSDDHLAAKDAEAERLRHRLKVAEGALKAVRRMTHNTDLPWTASEAACSEATKALAAIREEGGAK